RLTGPIIGNPRRRLEAHRRGDDWPKGLDPENRWRPFRRYELPFRDRALASVAPSANLLEPAHRSLETTFVKRAEHLLRSPLSRYEPNDTRHDRGFGSAGDAERTKPASMRLDCALI